jgi:TfoX/Sxy family transcriptional regulator of competence genes
MAYDEKAAARVRVALKRKRGLIEKKMFGGLAFLLDGHMCCGVIGDDLVLRLGEEEAARARLKSHTRPMDFTGRPMSSMVYVAPPGYRTEENLARWLDRAVRFVRTLPPKKSAGSRPRARASTSARL